MSRDFDSEFQNGVWQRFNPGGDGGVDFRLLDEAFLREGFAGNLYHGSLLSVIYCFAQDFQNIKFDSSDPEGVNGSLENKVLNAIKAAVNVLREYDPVMLNEKHTIFVLKDNAPASIKALFDELGLRTDIHVTSAGVAAASSADEAEAFVAAAHDEASLLGGSAGTEYADTTGWGPAAGQR